MIRWLVLWLVSNAANLLATLSLAAISYGCWLAWPPLGWIVPGSIIFSCLAWSRVKEQGPRADDA